MTPCNCTCHVPPVRWAAWLVAHRNGTAVLLDTAPPLQGRKLRKAQQVYRKARGLAR